MTSLIDPLTYFLKNFAQDTHCQSSHHSMKTKTLVWTVPKHYSKAFFRFHWRRWNTINAEFQFSKHFRAFFSIFIKCHFFFDVSRSVFLGLFPCKASVLFFIWGVTACTINIYIVIVRIKLLMRSESLVNAVTNFGKVAFLG